MELVSSKVYMVKVNKGIFEFVKEIMERGECMWAISVNNGLIPIISISL